MLQNLRTRAAARKAESGFSLIELLIVMVIIAILVLIAIPAISQYRTNARVAAVQSDARNVGTQVEGQYTLTQTYGTAASYVQTEKGTGLGGGTLAVGSTTSRLSDGVKVGTVVLSTAGDRVCVPFSHVSVAGTSDEFAYVTDKGVVAGTCAGTPFA